MSTQKIAFITGGNRGIGLETAKQLGKLNIFPVIGSRNSEQGEAAVEKLKAEGIEATFISFDVNRRPDHQTAFAYFKKKYGRLDILINNAGVHLEGEPGHGLGHNTTSLPEKLIRDTFDANFFGVIALTQTLLPLLRLSTAGRIVNLSSVLGSLHLHADPKSPIYSMKAFAYDTSKTALNAFTVHLAYDLKDSKIKVNSAHPGWVQTDMGGSSAPMKIEDGARTSVILATLPDEGPSGGFFHMSDRLPW